MGNGIEESKSSKSVGRKIDLYNGIPIGSALGYFWLHHASGVWSGVGPINQLFFAYDNVATLLFDPTTAWRQGLVYSVIWLMISHSDMCVRSGSGQSHKCQFKGHGFLFLTSGFVSCYPGRLDSGREVT